MLDDGQNCQPAYQGHVLATVRAAPQACQCVRWMRQRGLHTPNHGLRTTHPKHRIHVDVSYHYVFNGNTVLRIRGRQCNGTITSDEFW